MTVRILSSSESSVENSIETYLKNLAIGAVKSAKKLPEKWWPKRMDGYPVENLSAETCILVLEKNDKRCVEFFYWHNTTENDTPEHVWVLSQETYPPSTKTSGEIYLLAF